MIKNNNDLRKELKNSLQNKTGMSFAFTVDFADDEYNEMTETEIIEKIMLAIRPDASNMDRVEKECTHMLPDWYLDNGYVDSINIEKFVSEATFSDRIVARVYLNEKFYEYMNKQSK